MKNFFNACVKFTSFLALLNRKSSYSVIKMLIFSTIVAVFITGNNYLLGIVVDRIEAGYEFFYIALILTLILTFRIGNRVISNYYGYYCNKVSLKLTHLIQLDILKKIKKIKQECFDYTDNLDLMMRIKRNAAGQSANALTSLSSILNGILIVGLYAILLSFISWYITVVLLLSSILSVFISTKFGISAYALKRRQSKVERLAGYYESLLLERPAAKEVRMYGLFDTLLNRWHNYRNGIMREERVQVTQFTFLELLGKMVQATGFAISIIICGFLVINYESTIGNLVMLISLGTMFFGYVDRTTEQIGSVSRFFAFVDDALAFEEMPEELEDSRHITLRSSPNIEFKDVSFTYPLAEYEALKNINVEIASGETIVCVGENGSGKTTFISLLMGLYEPTKGEICICGEPLIDIKHQLRAHTAFVAQNFNKYQMSISDSLFFDRENDNAYEQSLYETFLDFLKDYPDKQNTYIGQMDSGAIELSGGQWQRMAIGRALAKPNVQLMILDEFTSALDPIVESKIYEEIKNDIQKFTTIITSHRLGVCSLADRILVFDNGEIVESGTHDDLITKQGVYYNLYNTQSSMFEV